MQYIVFTDLDGTLVDHDTYSYEAALPAIDMLKEKGIPLIFCTSKTRVEIEVYSDELDIRHPFISENGGAIFIPHEYFGVDYVSSRSTDRYDIIELGTEYSLLRNILVNIAASEDLDIKGFGDMTDAEVSEDTGLDIESARLAKQREYDEAFRLRGGENDAERLIMDIRAKGLNYTRGGRYWHIIGDNDKGKAVRILTNIYRKQFGDLKTVGLGDSLNDQPMLKAVDIPFLVQKPGSKYDPKVSDERINRVQGIGPVGWNTALTALLK